MWTVSYVLYTVIVGLFLISYRNGKGGFLKELIKKLNVIVNNRQKKRIRKSLSNNNNEGEERGIIDDIPGPLSIPLYGTKWIYFWRYKMTKIHDTYKGTFPKRSSCRRV